MRAARRAVAPAKAGAWIVAAGGELDVAVKQGAVILAPAMRFAAAARMASCR
jgi:hypothetical protein